MNTITGSHASADTRDWPIRFRRREMTADAHAAARARTDFEGWLDRQFVLSAMTRTDITMAVYEAVANAAEHAYYGCAPGEGTFDIDANYDVAQDSLTVTIEDRGQWHTRDPATAPRIARGRGIQLMYGLAEDASITTSATGTRVCLMWMRLKLRDAT